MTPTFDDTNESLDGKDRSQLDSRIASVPPVAAPTSIQVVCDSLTELGRRRKFCIGLVNKQTNAAKAFARSACGFSASAEEEDREAVNKRAGRIVDEFIAGKPWRDEDEDIVRSIGTELAIVRAALEPLEIRRHEIEKQMKKLTRSLPVAEWADGVAGFGPIGLAIIVAESGNLSNYPHPKMLWKRLGLAPYEGHAMSTWRMKGGLTAEEWTGAGYKPRRRAEIHACVADPMSKHQLESATKSETDFGKAKGPYGEVYVARRMATAASHPDWTKAHARMDALRIMTKSLIADLWSEWRWPGGTLKSTKPLAAADTSESVHAVAA